MLNKINYEQLKMLFDINEETHNIYRHITYTINKNSKNILYIFETYKEAERKYNELTRRFKFFINRKDEIKHLDNIDEINNKIQQQYISESEIKYKIINIFNNCERW